MDVVGDFRIFRNKCMRFNKDIVPDFNIAFYVDATFQRNIVTNSAIPANDHSVSGMEIVSNDDVGINQGHGCYDCVVADFGFSAIIFILESDFRKRVNIGIAAQSGKKIHLKPVA